MPYDCRKRCHQTRESAEEHLADLRRAQDEHPKRLERLMVYWCTQHAAFHIGHARTPAQRARYRKEKGRTAA